jgi:asparagine synthase (glutamine-hydrolysing)
MAEFAASIEWGRAPTQEIGEGSLTRGFRVSVAAANVERAPGAVLVATRRRAPAARSGVDLLVDHAAEVVVAVDCCLDDEDGLRERLRVSSDVSGAQLLLCAYRAWGYGFPGLLRGEFAGLIWDWGRQTLICFRDPLGVRPLFYAASARGMVIASDVEVILAAVGRSGSIDDQMVVEHLLWNYHSTDRTFWTHVRRLHGGHVLIAGPERAEVRRYWFVPATEARSRSMAAVHDEFRRLFLRALQRSLDGDAPMLAHLSGGVDSSTIVCAADWFRRQSPHSGPPLIVVSARYPGLGCDESPYIDAVTRVINLPAQSWDGRQADFRDLDDPCVAGAGWWTHRSDGTTSEFEIAARTGASCIISGLGGDHVGAPFGVFEERIRSRPLWYAWRTFERSDLKMSQRAQRLWVLARTVLPGFVRSRVVEIRGGRRAPAWLQHRWRTLAGVLAAETVRRTRGGFSSAIQEARWQELTGARLGLALDADHRAASGHDVEMRYPFLDRDLVDFALSLPRENWPSSEHHYRLHRSALADLLPEDIRLRTTKGRFSYAIAHRVRQGRDRIRRLFHDGEWASARWVDRSQVQVTFERLMSGTVDDTDLPAWQGVLATAHLEAWLRIVFGYASGGRDTGSRSG